MNKKAEDFTISPVAAIIIVLIVAGVLFLAVGNISSFQKEQTDVETCRLSFLALHQLGAAKDVKDFELNCPRVKTLLDKRYIKGKTLDREKVFDLLAREIFTCYSKTGKGQLNPEKSTAVKNACIICSEIIATPEVVALHDSFKGFDEYLYTRRIPGQKLYFSDLFNITQGSYDYDINEQQDTFFVLWRATKDIPSRLSFGLLGDYDIGYDFVPASLIYAQQPGGSRYCDKVLN
ncbi:hypothetical protein D6774_00365 [Candidatus Woesearchaeota archaeon]|jgi:hypothetical protein|nr:MAG: hypothetical protein D6774_00365 [Candidatus Woesearchaeota archaeon]